MAFTTKTFDFCEEDILHVLTASGMLKHPRKTHSAKHARTLRRAALDYINDWHENGVPPGSCNILLSRCPSFMSTHKLQRRLQLEDSIPPNSVNSEVEILRETCPKPISGRDINVSLSFNNVGNCGSTNAMCTNELADIVSTHSNMPKHQVDSGDGELEETDDDDEFHSTQVTFSYNGMTNEQMSLIRILQHWAAFTHAKHSHLTYLLKLLKHYQPDPCYDSLPATGHQLLYIDGKDFKTDTTAPNSQSLDESGGDEECDTSSAINNNGTASEADHDETFRPYESDSSSSRNFSTESTQASCHTVSSESSSQSFSKSFISSHETENVINSATNPTDINGKKAKKKVKRRPVKLQPVIEMDNGGKLIYFGLESALSGDSPGIVFKHADLLQFVNIYKEDPQLLPECLRSKIERLDRDKTIANALKVLSGESTDNKQAPSTSTSTQSSLPHFLIDANIDGVQAFNNSEKGEIIPILITIHSLAKSPDISKHKPRLINPSYPMVVGVFQGKCKPDINEFLHLFIKELKRLNPDNNSATVLGRTFTVTLRCIRTDGPMRSYLKRCKGHSGYWACERCIQPGTRRVLRKGKLTKNGQQKKGIIELLELDAPLREDAEFLTYFADDEGVSIDDHLPDHNDVSPLVDINFPMVTGFVIDPMHTLYGGAFRRKLSGFVYSKNEGKLSGALLAKIDARLFMFQKCCPLEFDRFVRSLTQCVNKYKDHELRQFLYYLIFPVFSGILNSVDLEHLMLLPQAMLLLGGYNPDQVSEDNIREASRLLKLYVKMQADFHYPVRYTTHCIIHLPEDASKYCCGVECLSAFVFENFQRLFRDILVSGNKPIEQIRNRLVERSKYILPTTPDGLVITTSEEFQKQMQNIKLRNETNSCHHVIEFKDRGENNAKILRLSKFTLTNKFPDNICLMKNKLVLVCRDIVEFPENSKQYVIIGTKFGQLEDIYTHPFRSSKFNVYLASKIGKNYGEWNVNGVSGKMYALPYKYDEQNNKLPDIYESKNKWIVSPLFHTLY